MLTLRSLQRVGTPIRCLHVTLAVLVLVAAGLSPSARAVELPTLYTAEVPLDPDADNPRKLAYELALVQVLGKVSGSALGNDAALVKTLFEDPSSYVMQFRPGARGTLWVSFDGRAIERILRDAGQPVWGADRPLTLVWLAVDWGQGSREIIAADDPDNAEVQSRSIDRNQRLRERILDSAERRGLPLIFPLLDTADLQSVAFSDIWGGFDERIVAASARYGADSILIGRIRPSSSRQENWSYYFSGDARSWTGSPESVIGQVADLLASEFAMGGDAPVRTVRLNVAGIVSIEAYGSLQKRLAAISVIESFVITGVSGDRVNYRVEVRGGADRLSRALRFSGLVEQGDAVGYRTAGGDAELEFYFGP